MIGANLRYLRDKRGLSQTALAEALELKRGNISSYEKELAQPSLQSAVKIAAFFEVPLEALINRDLSSAEIQEESLIEKFSHHHLVKSIKDKLHTFNKEYKNERVEKLQKQNTEIMKMIEGFKAFHDYRMNNFSMKKADIESLSHDYKNLISLMETLLKTNDELIKLAEK